MTNLMRGPSGYKMTRQSFWEQAQEQPRPWATTLWDTASQAAKTAPIMGDIYREATTPSLGVTPDLDSGHVPTHPGDIALRPLTDPEARERGVKLLSADDYKASPHFRKDIPWQEGMTDARAEALAADSDLRAVRQFYAEKRPLTAFLGNLAGTAINPINYVPIFGQVGFAASVGRIGYMSSRMLYGAGEAAANTAIFSLASRDNRARYGDDVSINAMLTEMAFGALAGGVFGAAGGAWTKMKHPERVAAIRTQNNVRKAAIVLNDAVTSLALDGEVRLGGMSRNAFYEVNRNVQRFETATEGTATARSSKPLTLSAGETTVTSGLGLGPDVSAPGATQTMRQAGGGGQFTGTTVTVRPPSKATLRNIDERAAVLADEYRTNVQKAADLGDRLTKAEAELARGATPETFTDVQAKVERLRGEKKAVEQRINEMREFAEKEGIVAYKTDTNSKLGQEAIDTLAARGKSNKEIAAATGIPEKAIKAYRDELAVQRMGMTFRTPKVDLWGGGNVPTTVPVHVEAARAQTRALADVTAKSETDALIADAKEQGVDAETGKLVDEAEIRELVDQLDEHSKNEMLEALKLFDEELAKLDADKDVLDGIHACTVGGMR